MVGVRRGMVVAVAALLALAGCTAAQPSGADADPAPADVGAAPAGLARYYAQALAWTPCGTAAECATLQVPKDYDDPAGHGDFAIAVLRVRATGTDPRGALVVNPGGPGGSGVSYAAAAPGVVGPDVLAAYDVVGFDPRGVGRSAPVDCLTDAELDDLIEGDPSPDSPQELQQTLAEAAGVGAGCQQRSPQIAPWIDSESVARDLDVLRAALGQARLDYLGKSYGTTLGALYAELFPERVGRFVLDGVLDPALTSDEVSLGQAQGFESALRRFVADCLQQGDCPLAATTVEAGVREIATFLAGLDEAPLPAAPNRPLTESLGASAVLYYLYFPPGDWAQLRVGLADAFAGDGATLLRMLDGRLERGPDGVYRDNSQEAFYAVTCLDRRPGADLTARAAQFAAAAPTFGPYLAWTDAVCAQWPAPPVSEPRTVVAAGAAPVLVVSTEHDPATPYPWGVGLADSMAAAVLVSYNGDGHTAYRNGSSCVDAVVDAYLVDGAVPAADVRCGY
jgi:pimeloyl-ACP methyl ester carboxylesterase